MSYVAIWLQACIHWRCAYFQTLSWNDTIFVVDWDILYKLCGSANISGVKDLSSLVRYDDSFFAAIMHVQRIVPLVRPRPNIRSHSVLLGSAFATKSTSFECWLGAISLSCADVASAARHISTHFDRVRPDSCSNFLLTAFSRTPHTILSQIRWSFKVPNSQVSARARKAVTYVSMDSVCSWEQLLNFYLS